MARRQRITRIDGVTQHYWVTECPSASATVVDGAPNLVTTRDLESRIARTRHVTLPPAIHYALAPLSAAFTRAGYNLFAVGGSVRDAALGRDSKDLDLTTDAQPADIQRLTQPLVDAMWDTGIEFGTVAVQRGEDIIEITTHRADEYDGATRKPSVTFGTSITEDLARRDLTINAIAVNLADGSTLDPFNGVHDLHAGVIHTPIEPEVSFGDDPLRMMRAARFAAQLGFTIHPDTHAAMTQMSGAITSISVERVQAELDKIITSPHPARGLNALRDTGIAAHILTPLTAADSRFPTVTALPAQAPASVKTAAVLMDCRLPSTDAATHLSRLRYPGTTAATVTRLIALQEAHRQHADLGWTAARVREFCHQASDLYSDSQTLTVAHHDLSRDPQDDVFQSVYRDLSSREDLHNPVLPVNGKQVMNILGTKPGKHIGAALHMLRQYQYESGPLTVDRADAAIRAWWQQQVVG